MHTRLLLLSALILLFVIVHVQETDAKPNKNKKRPATSKNSTSPHPHPSNTTMLSRRFNRASLKKFLAKRPALWKARAVTKMKKQHYRRLLGHAKPSRADLEHIRAARKRAAQIRKHYSTEQLPQEFDSRQKWSNCASIKTNPDQSRCGSCWAVASATVMSDRACIATNGQRQPKISAADLLSCCKECLDGGTDGCQGGISSRAWAYYQTQGVVTGGAYNSNDGCKPYPFPPTSSPMQQDELKAPACQQQCSAAGDYQSSKHYGTGVVFPSGMEEMQREIYENGPIAVGIDVFEDFMEYHQGVYYHREGAEVGGHLVRFIGWGVENEVPYWLGTNSWGDEWGTQGTFKIVRGTNHVGVEKFAVASAYDQQRSAAS